MRLPLSCSPEHKEIEMLSKIADNAFEIAMVAIVLYLVVTNAGGFSQVAASIGNVYTSGVKALQGR